MKAQSKRLFSAAACAAIVATGVLPLASCSHNVHAPGLGPGPKTVGFGIPLKASNPLRKRLSRPGAIKPGSTR